jgi:hypothetical protein
MEQSELSEKTGSRLEVNEGTPTEKAKERRGEERDSEGG